MSAVYTSYSKRKAAELPSAPVNKHSKKTTTPDADPYTTVEKMAQRYYFVQSCVKARADCPGEVRILYLETSYGSLTKMLLEYFNANELFPCNFDQCELDALERAHPGVQVKCGDIIDVSQEGVWLGVWYDMEETWCDRKTKEWNWDRIPKTFSNSRVCAVTLTNLRTIDSAEQHAIDLSALLSDKGGQLNQQPYAYVGKGGVQNMIFGLALFNTCMRVGPGDYVTIKWLDGLHKAHVVNVCGDGMLDVIYDDGVYDRDSYECVRQVFAKKHWDESQLSRMRTAIANVFVGTNVKDATDVGSGDHEDVLSPYLRAADIMILGIASGATCVESLKAYFAKTNPARKMDSCFGEKACAKYGKYWTCSGRGPSGAYALTASGMQRVAELHAELGSSLVNDSGSVAASADENTSAMPVRYAATMLMDADPGTQVFDSEDKWPSWDAIKSAAKKKINAEVVDAKVISARVCELFEDKFPEGLVKAVSDPRIAVLIPELQKEFEMQASMENVSDLKQQFQFVERAIRTLVRLTTAA